MKIFAVACFMCACSAVGAVYDVVVVGGGASGTGAALAAARMGAKTLLVERDTRIGGTAVQADVVNVGLFHAWKKQVIDGPCWTLVTNAVDLGGGRLPDFSLQNGARNWMIGCIKINPAVYSALAEEKLTEAGVDMLFSTSVYGMKRTESGWSVEIASDEGLSVVKAKNVIDATGNAAVAAMAGAKRVRSDDETRQPGTFFIYLNTKNMKFDAEAVDKAQEEAVKNGSLLTTDVGGKMSRYIRSGGGWGNYIPLADNTSASSRADTNRRGRQAMLRILRFIRSQPGLENATIKSTATETGCRETYRVVGEETITQEDYLNGTVFPDSLCYSFWMIDPHNAKTKSAKLIFPENGNVATIRLGAMLPKGTENLFVVGRAVSSDHGANSALRVQVSCMAIGQSAGVAAALAAQQGIDVRQIRVEEIKKALRKIGAIVP